MVVTEDLGRILRAKFDLLEAYTSVMGNPGIFGEKVTYARATHTRRSKLRQRRGQPRSYTH